TQSQLDDETFVNLLTSAKTDGRIVGILHTLNDSPADVVQSDETRLLYGQDYFYEYLLNMRFKISPFSFFQTNTLGAEVLYEKVGEYVGETKDKLIYDLYTGTGTIAQMMAPYARKVVGVEIVEEAVDAARLNAEDNHLTNCEFIAGDVLKVVDNLTEKPDMIILDPPRDGVNPKALRKIIRFGVDEMVYVSCKPTSLMRDLVMLQEAGYAVKRCCLVDMFPGTTGVETVCLLSRKGQTANQFNISK
ncbi:MAG TPA: 23S rRNA (uracil(1939)-C(5))-methyltransferase RlmD, partial [Candidatus Anaerobutyricum stercoris]|nr:23S rRNA (uracil(1939)-C(5))-methyltransferase RlmD [Candidatus Anaerobutyricum stercoris]